MASEQSAISRAAGARNNGDGGTQAEQEGLLLDPSHSLSDDDHIARKSWGSREEDSNRPGLPKRLSSFAQPRPDGIPRTPHRVRFHVTEPGGDPNADGQDSTRTSGDWFEEDDYLGGDDSSGRGGGGGGGAQRLPLLRDMQAPSIAVANDLPENPEDLLESARPRSGLKSAFMNMANSIIGAGIIGQPYAFKQAGLLTGIVLLICLTVTVDWTVRLIVVNAKLSGTDSFQATMQKCFGRSGLIAISLAQWAFAFGGMLAFCIIIGDTIPHVLSAIFPSLDTMPVLWLLTNRRAIIVLFVFGLSYPLSLYRDVAMLAKASTLALLSMGIIVLTVLIQGPLQPAEARGQLRGSLLMNDGVFQAIGVISFAFVCHHNSLLIYGSLKTPTMDRFARVTHYSTGISMAACMAMALSGYLVFGDKTQGNVLNNFPTDNILVNLARLCFGLNMITTLPLECFVCREVITEYYYPRAPHHQFRHVLITTSLVGAAVAVALLTCDVGIVFELIGATSGCALAYILPPLCYLNLTTRKKRGWEVWAAWACIAFGAGVMLVSVALSAAKNARGEGGGGECH